LIIPTLRSSSSIAVLGCSDKPNRDNFQVVEYLFKQGYQIIPVNPDIQTILNQRAYPDLTKILESIDVVDVFRSVDFLPDHLDEIVQGHPRVVWLQPSMVNERVAGERIKTNIKVVKDRCTRVEHRVHGSKQKLI